jgi:hypothetical protein
MTARVRSFPGYKKQVVGSQDRINGDIEPRTHPFIQPAMKPKTPKSCFTQWLVASLNRIIESHLRTISMMGMLKNRAWTTNRIEPEPARDNHNEFQSRQKKPQTVSNQAENGNRSTAL